jgi:hypothetical protein
VPYVVSYRPRMYGSAAGRHQVRSLMPTGTGLAEKKSPPTEAALLLVSGPAFQVTVKHGLFDLIGKHAKVR